MSPTDPTEYVSFAEAARRLPSPHAGKRTHLATVYRLAQKHRLPILRRGRWRFVRWADLLALFSPEGVPDPRLRKPKAADKEWTEAVLRRAGLGR